MDPYLPLMKENNVTVPVNELDMLEFYSKRIIDSVQKLRTENPDLKVADLDSNIPEHRKLQQFLTNIAVMTRVC